LRCVVRGSRDIGAVDVGGESPSLQPAVDLDDMVGDSISSRKDRADLMDSWRHALIPIA
jgi:hypothetical protein